MSASRASLPGVSDVSLFPTMQHIPPHAILVCHFGSLRLWLEGSFVLTQLLSPYNAANLARALALHAMCRLRASY